jgi:hypothetical protein
MSFLLFHFPHLCCIENSTSSPACVTYCPCCSPLVNSVVLVPQALVIWYPSTSKCYISLDSLLIVATTIPSLVTCTLTNTDLTKMLLESCLPLFPTTRSIPFLQGSREQRRLTLMKRSLLWLCLLSLLYFAVKQRIVPPESPVYSQQRSTECWSAILRSHSYPSFSLPVHVVWTHLSKDCP